MTEQHWRDPDHVWHQPTDAELAARDTKRAEDAARAVWAEGTAWRRSA